MTKPFKLSGERIQPLAPGHGGCIASDMITVGGHPVRFMYREAPDDDTDSGWRFLSGLEDDAYMAVAENLSIYDVNTIANYDPSIIPFLDAPMGSAYEKTEDSGRFVRVDDWSAPQDDP